MYFICRYIQEITENNLWHLTLRPHVCTLYQIIYALTSLREWSVPDSGSPYKGGVCCLYRGMTIMHRLQIKDTVTF